VTGRNTQGTIAAIGIVIAIATSTPAITTIGIVTTIRIATTVVPHDHDIRLATAKHSTTRTPHQTQDDQANDASAHTTLLLQEHRYNATSVQFQITQKHAFRSENVSPFGRFTGTFCGQLFPRASMTSLRRLPVASGLVAGGLAVSVC
jgi:hypothetical protein